MRGSGRRTCLALGQPRDGEVMRSSGQRNPEDRPRYTYRIHGPASWHSPEMRCTPPLSMPWQTCPSHAGLDQSAAANLTPVFIYTMC